MVVAECPKVFDVHCIWGRIVVSLEKIFVFKYSYTLFQLVFTWNIYRKKVTRTFWVHYFGPPYHSNGTKIHLGGAQHVYWLLLIFICYNPVCPKNIFENKLDDCKGFLRLINVIEKNFLLRYFPWDIEIQGWCPAGKSYLVGRRCLCSLDWPPF